MYTNKDFRFDKLLSNGIRCMVGHFDTNKGVIYSFAFGHADRNDDYFEYVQITKNEYEELMKQEWKSLSYDDVKKIYEKWIKPRKVLCNEFSMNPVKYIPGFTDEEIN